MKGNQWVFISPDHKGALLFLGGVTLGVGLVAPRGRAKEHIYHHLLEVQTCRYHWRWDGYREVKVLFGSARPRKNEKNIGYKRDKKDRFTIENV